MFGGTIKLDIMKLYNLYEQFLSNFNKTLIVEGRYKLFLTGIKNTIIIAFFATLIGIIIGLFVAVIRYSAKKQQKIFYSRQNM